MSRKSGPESVFLPGTLQGGVQNRQIFRPSVFFQTQLSYLRTQSVQGGSRRAPLVVKIHRRPLYFERWNAAPMQHDAMTAADLEHCRRWLLEGASHCSSCGALIIVLLATDAYHLPMKSSPAPQRIPLVRALANTRPAMTACMAGDEPSRTARAYPTHACAWRSVRLYEPRASFPTRAALGFVRKR